jgi:hypothetical protein
MMQVPEHSWSNDEDLPRHKQEGYMERMMEMADIKRKELKEEGAHCGNCGKRSTDASTFAFCYMFERRPEAHVCYSWERAK